MLYRSQSTFLTSLWMLLLLFPVPRVSVAQTAGEDYVNLAPQEETYLEGASDIGRANEGHVLSNPWWRNFDIYGFGAAGYYDTGSDATRASGGFEVKEATLFIEADVWEGINFFVELQTNRLGKDDQLFTRTGEVYLHFRELRLGQLPPFGLKLGRFDIPFGEEYLWQDSIDNPLITNSASYPYGWDEGVLIYGEIKGLSWIAAVMDGTDERSREENSDKAVAIKIYGNPIAPLYLSASLMTNGDASKSAIEFGGSHFQPLGASHTSTLGNSPSTEVGAGLLEFNARYQLLSSHPSKSAYVSVSLGGAKQDDVGSAFDRSFSWFSLEPRLDFNDRWYGVVRYSEIGTYDSDEGYHFDGKTFAGGNNAFGYDTKRFQRVGIGLGWTPNPNIRAKLEIGKDRFDLVDGSPLADGGNRGFIGFEIAAGF